MIDKGNGCNYYALPVIEGHKHSNHIHHLNKNPKENIEDDVLPEERIKEAYIQHCNEIKGQLLEMLKEVEPSFFERLVLELLLRMGYV